MICPFCKSEIPDVARKCRQCRAWLLKPGEKVPETSPDQPPVSSGEMPAPAAPPPPPAPPPQVQYIPVPVPQYAPPPPQPPPPPAVPPPPPGPSAGFAVVTLVSYFFFFPIAPILNIIGIFTGPRRGCFVAMFFFILAPIALLFIIALASSTGIDWIDDIMWQLKSDSTPQQRRIERPIHPHEPDWGK